MSWYIRTAMVEDKNLIHAAMDHPIVETNTLRNGIAVLRQVGPDAPYNAIKVAAACDQSPTLM